MNIRIKPWSWTISTLKAKSSLLKEEFYEIYKLSFQQGAIANNFSYPVTFWYLNLNLPWVVFFVTESEKVTVSLEVDDVIHLSQL